MPIDFCCKMWYNRSRKTGRRRVRGECRLWLAYANSSSRNEHTFIKYFN